MESRGALQSPIEVRLVDSDDELLELVVRLRGEVGKTEERQAFVRGLVYIALQAKDYIEDEMTLVRGVASAFGISEALLARMVQEASEDSSEVIKLFADVGDKQLRQRLLEEMVAFSYLKGYQLASEGEAIARVADAMGVKQKKVEKSAEALRVAMQGQNRTGRAYSSKEAVGIGAIAAGVAVCAATQGVDMPSIGTAIKCVQNLTTMTKVNIPRHSRGL